MGLSMLSDELLLSLAERWPCREFQVQQLSRLLSKSLPSPPALVIHGPRATGKSEILKAFLERCGLRHAIIPCRESITTRHLLERAVNSAAQATRSDNEHDTQDYNGRCESLSMFAVHLQQLLKSEEKFILAFDGIDKQREAVPTLLPALARLGETIANLTVVLIVQHAPSGFLHQNGVPHIHFPPYTRSQSIHVVSQRPLDIFLEVPPAELEYDDEVHSEDKAWLWPRFCAAVWDAMAQNAARDLVAFRNACHTIWRPFVAPIVKGDFGTRDFSRLLVTQRRLFQDENALLDSILSTPGSSSSDLKSRTHELPYFAKWLLVSAYLASTNPARTDPLHFMKATERKRRKKGGGTARSGGGHASRNRTIPRHLLAASTFTLDRLLAILHAILPDEFRATIDVYKQIATLTSLRLLQRAGSIGSADPLEPGGKWRVGTMVTWDYAQALGRTLDFTMTDYVTD